MCGDYFNLNSQRSQPIVSSYDIHIYFEPGKQSELTAFEVAQTINAMFPDVAGTPHRVGIVGPHASPNYEVDITTESFGKVVSWLQLNSKGLSILVHPHTGDEVRDHLESAIWLGKQLEFNAEFFVKYKAAKIQKHQP